MPLIRNSVDFWLLPLNGDMGTWGRGEALSVCPTPLFHKFKKRPKSWPLAVGRLTTLHPTNDHSVGKLLFWDHSRDFQQQRIRPETFFFGSCRLNNKFSWKLFFWFSPSQQQIRPETFFLVLAISTTNSAGNFFLVLVVSTTNSAGNFFLVLAVSITNSAGNFFWFPPSQQQIQLETFFGSCRLNNKFGWKLFFGSHHLNNKFGWKLFFGSCRLNNKFGWKLFLVPTISTTNSAGNFFWFPPSQQQIRLETFFWFLPSQQQIRLETFFGSHHLNNKFGWKLFLVLAVSTTIFDGKLFIVWWPSSLSNKRSNAKRYLFSC